MHYYKVEFKIECSEDLKQIVNDLLADMAAEAGFESFEDSEIGIDGYVQQDLFHQEHACCQYLFPEVVRESSG